MVALVAISLIGPLAIHVFLPLIPVVQASFAISEGLAGLTFSIALLVMSIATLVYGSLSDRHGRRRVLLVGLALFTIGSAVSALAPSIGVLILGRTIQAIGAGCGIALSRAIARDAYGADVLVKIFAYLTMAYTLGPMVAPLLGGMFVDLSGWRSVFWFATAFGGLVMFMAWVVLYETRLKEETQQASTSLLRNYATLFSKARFNAFVLQSGFASGAFMASATAATYLMKGPLGRSATEFGLYFTMYPIGYLLGNLVSSKISNRFSIEQMVLAGSIINGVACAIQSVTILSGYLVPAIIFLPGGLMTFGQGIGIASAQVGAMRVVPSLSGTAAGIGASMPLLLGAAFSQLYSLLADGTPIPMVITVSIGSVLALAAGIASYKLKPGR
jgi:DHA1 family bicyclomycin/chloramphenicol resistance-like MFS transporter